MLETTHAVFSKDGCPVIHWRACIRRTFCAVRAVPQVDFLDYVISPMFSLLTQVLTGIDEYVKVIKLNRANYKGALFFPSLSFCLRSPFLSLSR